MSRQFRIIYESYDSTDPECLTKHCVLLEGTVNKPANCLDFALSHETQINLLQAVQDELLPEKAELIYQDIPRQCPKCPGQLIKFGKRSSIFHDVFTDHMIAMQRLHCPDCGHELPSTIKKYFGGTLSGGLSKVQAEMGATHTFRDSEKLLETFSRKDRPVNNHDRVKQVTEQVGNTLNEIEDAEKALLKVEEAKELVLNVDGGHIKTTSDQRTIEALTSVIYQPDALQSNSKDTRHHLSSKSCAASVKQDEQKEIVSRTIIAALKQGLTINTHITALCDGATNCWNVVEALRPLCASMTCILDWFHIGMKMQNIALPSPLKEKFLRVKWHLWRGNTTAAIKRLTELRETAESSTVRTKIQNFMIYIQNNIDRIVNYRERHKKGMVFTSNLAESTVESLINQRCKGQQHMRWSREGLNPILQLRAKLASNDWENKWQTAVLNATE